MKRLFLLCVLYFFISGYILSQNAWINEIHYDNASTDVGEFVEIVIENPGSYALSDFEVVLYNGSTGASYNTQALNLFTIGNTVGNYTFYTWYPTSIQNGAPDGLCLSYNGTVISGQFLSYEGTFTATNGPANGLVSVNIGVSEGSSTSVGESLQLTGSGAQYSDFTWVAPAPNTSGGLNNGQTLTGVSMSSDIIKKSGWSEPLNIDYKLYLVTSGLTTANSIETGSFTIRDGGGANDSDGFTTTLTDISFDIDNHENVEAIAIFDGNTNIAEITNVNSTFVDFSGFSLSAPDDGEKDFSIRVTFKTYVVDNENLEFTITSATAGSGSGFADADAGGAETDNTGDNNKIEVIADRLAINTPSTVYVNNNFTIIVSAVDINNNTDLDEISSVTLSRNSGSGSLTSLTGLSQNLTNGTYQWTDIQYDVAEVFSIEAQSGSLNNAVSNDITATTSPYIDLIISEVADPLNPSGPDYEKFVEIYNFGSSAIDFGSSTWYISRQANGDEDNWEDIQLTDVINAGETYVVAYDETAFSTAFGFDADQYSSYISGNGNDVYALFSGGDQTSGVLIDIYGEIDVNGFHTAWDYKDSKAVRKKSVANPSNTWNAAEWVIIPADIYPLTINELTPDWHNKDLSWTGNSSDWADASNWNDGSGSSNYAPDAGCDITISGSAAKDAVVYRRSSCNEMNIESGSVVTISSNPNPVTDTTACFLVTGGTVANNAGTSGLIVKSDPNGDGTFILGSGTTIATIERYLIDDQSHLISAPITDATADNLFQDHNPEVYLYEHHEEDDTWQYLVPTSTPMPSGQGFSTWVDDATPNYIIANFDGTLTSSDLTLSSSVLSYTSSEYGWNLIGNPFSAPLDWDKGDWDTTNIEGTVWVWDPVLDDYRWRNAFRAGTLYRGIIPMGQAFFVRAQNNGPSITIPANARSVHTKRDYYKSSSREIEGSEYLVDHVRLYALNESHLDEVWISFSETGTYDFDNGWDVSKVSNTNRSVNIYIPKEIRNQCLEHLPTLLVDEERIVEMNFETTVDGEHTLAIDMTYLPNTNVTLEDLKYNQTQDMDYDSVYSFVAFADDDPNRFRIHFNKTTTGIEFQEFDPATESSVQIYSYEKNIYIKKEDMNSSGYVMVYDLYGREILTQALEQTSLMKIPVHLNNTYLIVKVISDNKVVTSKVYIR